MLFRSAVTRRSLGHKFTSVILVLPRFAYALKYHTLPTCHPSELREALENQIELNSMFTAEEVLFDSFSYTPEEPTVAGNITHGVYLAPKSVLAPWKKALQAANWNLAAVTTQTQVAVDAMHSLAQNRPCVIVVANDSGVEFIPVKEGTARASRFVESGPKEACDMHRVAFEMNRLMHTATDPGTAVATDFYVVGPLADEVIPKLIELNPELATKIRRRNAILSSDDATSRTGVNSLSRMNLLRKTTSISPETVRKRRRVRLLATAILGLLTGLLIYDRVVHRYDDAIDALTADIAANEQLLTRGQSVEDIYQHLDERRSQQRD